MKKKKNFFLLVGEEENKKKERIEEIIQKYSEKDIFGSLSLKIIDCENESIENILSEFKVLPFGADGKTVVLNNFEEIMKEEKKYKLFIEYLNSPYENIIHILVAKHLTGEKKKINEIMKKLEEKKSEIEEFDLLNNKELNNYIRGELKKENIRYEEGVVSKLIEYSNNNYLYLREELNKLINYGKTKGEIREEDVDLMIENIRLDIIFNMIDELIVNRNYNEFIKLLNKVKGDANYPSAHLLAILDNIELLYYCKARGIETQQKIAGEKELNINIKRAYFIEQKIRRIKDLSIFKRIIKNIRKIDEVIKTSYYKNVDLLFEEIYV